MGEVAGLLLLSLWLTLGCSAAGAATLPKDASIDQTLTALEQRGQSLKDFVADVALETLDPALGNFSTRTGKVWFQRRGDEHARIRVLLEKLIEDEKTRTDRKEYLLEGEWLTERTYRSKIEVKRQVLRPGEKINLLKLGEGPFPLPIGQPPDEVKKQFDVQQLDPAADIEGEPPVNTLRLKLTPHEDTSLARKFKSIDLWIDRDLHMPVRIEVLDRNETSIQTTRLENLQINVGLGDGDFKLEPVGDDWTRSEEAFEE